VCTRGLFFFEIVETIKLDIIDVQWTPWQVGAKVATLLLDPRPPTRAPSRSVTSHRTIQNYEPSAIGDVDILLFPDSLARWRDSFHIL
jgi:hypothetical protein